MRGHLRIKALFLRIITVITPIIIYAYIKTRSIFAEVAIGLSPNKPYFI